MTDAQVEQISEVRATELEILQAARELARYEDGSLRFGLGRLSVGRNHLGRGDDNLRIVTDGARKLIELAQIAEAQSAETTPDGNK